MILKSWVCHAAGWMQMRMENAGVLPPEKIVGFLVASVGIEFTGQTRAERYQWVQEMLIERRYFSLGKKERGAVRQLLSKVTGLSLPQATRRILQRERKPRVAGVK